VIGDLDWIEEELAVVLNPSTEGLLLDGVRVDEQS